MGRPRNHPELIHFSTETRGFGDPPFLGYPHISTMWGPQDS